MTKNRIFRRFYCIGLSAALAEYSVPNIRPNIRYSVVHYKKGMHPIGQITQMAILVKKASSLHYVSTSSGCCWLSQLRQSILALVGR